MGEGGGKENNEREEKEEKKEKKKKNKLKLSKPNIFQQKQLCVFSHKVCLNQTAKLQK